MEPGSGAPSANPLRFAPPPVSRRGWAQWWRGEGGYREVLALAWPLFLSYGSATILQFIDRMFLTWYSPEGMAATAPSGMLAFTIQALFLGLVGYAATFVAQYTGAGRPRQAVAAVWQAVYLAVLASLLILPLGAVGGTIFRWAGHDPALQPLERAFFAIFVYGAFPFIASSALSAYFIGLGQTRVVLWVNVTAAAVNIALDYLLIFGHWGAPELGVPGAALASVCAQSVALVILAVAFWRAARPYYPEGAWRLDRALTARLLRYGSASGLQFMLDILAWTVFLMLVGRLGAVPLGATNIAFQLNSIAFFPVLGIALAASTLVGQYLGRNLPALADRAVWSGLHLGLYFTLVLAVLYLAIPHWLTAPFALRASAAFTPVRAETIVILRFVAAYCLFDVGNLVFAAALKGAGDTVFVMFLSTGIMATVMLVPTLLWCVQPGGPGIYGAWAFLTAAVCLLSLAFLTRYLRGHWREMRVIERHE